MAKNRHPDISRNEARGTFFEALTGRAGADVTGSSGGDLRSMLMAAYGTSARDPRSPNTAAAARGLGVSQRTVQRWIASPDKQHQKPRTATLKKLSTRARQAATTKRGRERSIAPRRDRLTKRGFRLSITGVQGPDHGPGYTRRRNVPFDIDPDRAEAVLDAYIQGGDAGVQEYLVKNVHEIYHDSWVFEDIDSVNLFGPYGTDI